MGKINRAHCVSTNISSYVCFSSLVCEDPVGIERGLYNITASSYKGAGNEPWRGRLNSQGIWRPKTNYGWEFLQVSFGHLVDITGVATQGETAACGRVRIFFLHYSLDALRYDQYFDPFTGNVSA